MLMFAGVPSVVKPGAHELVLRQARQLLLHEVRQLQILEQQVEELVARQLEDEVVLALARVAGLTATPALPAARPREPVAAHELAIARVDALAPPPLRDREGRLRDVAGGDLDPLALVDFGDAAAGGGVGDGALQLLAKALEEALSIDDTLVLCIEPSINDQRHQRSPA
jgi:hypothetical protein